MRTFLALALTCIWLSPANAAVEVHPYGTTSAGQTVNEYILRNAGGAEVHIIGYGGIVTEIDVPDRGGRKANVALGFGSLAQYEARNQDYRLGAIIGRYAGRIA